MKTSLLSLCVGVLSFLCLAVLVISLSPLGLMLGVRVLNGLIPGEITLKGIQGRLIDSLQIKEMEYRDEDHAYTLQGLRIKWRPMHLFDHTLSIKSLKADRLVVQAQSRGGNLPPLETWQSPSLALIIDKLVLNTVEINGKEATDLRASLALNELGLRLRQGHLSLPQIELKGDANLGPGFHPPIRIRAQESFMLAPEIKGELDIQGDLQLLEGHQVFSESLEGKIDFTAQEIGPNTVVNWQSELSLPLTTELKSRGSIKWAEGQFEQLSVQTLSLLLDKQRRFVLTQPALIIPTAEGLQIKPPLCLRGEHQSSLCAEISPTQTLLVRLNKIPHGMLTHYLFPRAQITGQMNALLEITAHTLDLQAHFSPMELRDDRRQEKSYFLTQGGDLHLNLQGDQITSELKFALLGKDQLQGSLAIHDWKDHEKAQIEAQFTGKITQWDPLQSFITETNDFSGQLDLNLRAEGSLWDPVYKGAVALSGARLALPGQGIILEGGQLRISPSPLPRQLALNGSVRSGSGEVLVDGLLNFTQAWPALDLRIKGNRFTLTNTPKALVYASPDLRIQTHERTVDISGEMHIPEAMLNLKGYQSYLAPSPDIVILEEGPVYRRPLYTLNTRVLLSLGRAIRLQASHLNTGVEGRVHLVKLGEDPLRATGQLYGVNGKYAAYGKKLDLSQAILNFNNSPLDNPSMFIEASRQVQVSQSHGAANLFADPSPQNKANSIHEGTVGLRITGTVQNPKYTFYSTPPMSEADQLSYLLTGAPSSQVGSAQAAFMFAALTETSGLLGVSDTDSARLQKITQAIGIDFNIESANRYDADSGQVITDTNLVVGKTFRNRLYVSYTVGLLDPMNMFRVRYQLSRHWAVQSQTNTQGDTGGDILYGIESDRFLGIE
jgi:autotransporter translocation and assembly factor TamB